MQNDGGGEVAASGRQQGTSVSSDRASPALWALRTLSGERHAARRVVKQQPGQAASARAAGAAAAGRRPPGPSRKAPVSGALLLAACRPGACRSLPPHALSAPPAAPPASPQ